MKAIHYASYGGVEAMSYSDIPVPAPGKDEVLVRIRAAGVNPVDIAVSQGYLKDFRPLSFPAIAGCEMAGVVDSVGSDVKSFERGDAVHAATGISGAFAEYVVLKESALVRKPHSLGFNEAAGLPIAASTAVSALNDGKVGSGTRVVIHAAAGGVGSVVVQLAKARGAEVIALASAGNIAFVKSLGADRVVDRATAYEKEIRDVDVVIDAFGPPAQARSWEMLKRGGVLLSLVTAPSAEEAARHGVRSAMVYGTPTPQVLSDADVLAAAGKLKVHISRLYPLAEAKAALAESGSGKVRGKLILVVSE